MWCTTQHHRSDKGAGALWMRWSRGGDEEIRVIAVRQKRWLPCTLKTKRGNRLWRVDRENREVWCGCCESMVEGMEWLVLSL